MRMFIAIFVFGLAASLYSAAISTYGLKSLVTFFAGLPLGYSAYWLDGRIRETVHQMTRERVSKFNDEGEEITNDQKNR